MCSLALATENTSWTLEAHLTEKQLMALRRMMAKAAMRESIFSGGSQDMKIGWRKYLANVKATAAFLSAQIRVWDKLSRGLKWD